MPPPRPLFAWGDLQRLALQRGAVGLLALTPKRFEPRLTRRAAQLWTRLKGSEINELRRVIADTVGGRFSKSEARAIAEELARRTADLMWARMRAVSRHGWSPRIEIDGFEHIERGLTAGRGVVIWFFSFCDSPIWMKALSDAGARLSHLSTVVHGAPGRSRFGVRFTAPLFWRAETFHLAERIVFADPSSPGFVRRIDECLRANGCLSVRADMSGRPGEAVRLFDRPARLPGGGASLAFRNGSTLVTGYAVREGPDRYRVVVERPIDAQREQGRKAFVREAVEEMARRLERRIEAAPADWEAWRWVERLFH